MNRPLALVALASNVVWVALVAVLCTDSGIEFVSFFIFVFGGIGLLGLWLFRLLLYVIWGRKVERSRWQGWTIEPIVVLLVGVGILSGAGFHARFTLSRPFLSRYVESVQAGRVVLGRKDVPERVGLFRVREVELQPSGVVRLITTKCSLDDCGIVYSTAGEPPRVGEDVYTRITGGWWQWWRSW